MPLEFTAVARAIISGVASAVPEPDSRSFRVVIDGITGATPSSVQSTVTIYKNPLVINLKATRITGKAPLAVGFDVIGSRSGLLTEGFADIYYSWDFGDSKAENWRYGAKLHDKNVAYGPVADHVFETPGNYTVTVVAIDKMGNVNSKTVSVEVTDWTAADTIYIANGTLPAAGVEGVLAGATYYNETTWSAAVSRMAANKRILLRRGDSWACAGSINVPNGTLIGAYGTGTKPTVTSAGATQTPFSLNGGNIDVRIVDIRHVGPGPNIADSGMVSTSNNKAVNILMLRLESVGSTFGYLSAAPSTENVFITDCDFSGYGVTGLSTNIAAYFSHADGFFVRGNFFDQAPSHLVRIGGGNRGVIDSNKFRRPDGAGNGRHAVTVRGGSAATGEWTEHVVMSNNDVDTRGTTSQWTFQVAPTNTVLDEQQRYILVERNVVYSDYLPMYFEVSSHLTVRNNLCVTTNETAAIHLSAINTVGTPRPDGCRVYNNTCYKTGSGAFDAVSINGLVTNTVIRNILAYAPNSTSPTATSYRNGADAPQVSQNSSDAQILGVRPWSSATPTVVTDFKPVGYAVSAGAQMPVYRDIDLQAITGTPDIGALRA